MKTIYSNILLVFTAILFLSNTTSAQDVIYRNNGKTIQSKIIEIGEDYVKYKEYDNQDGPLYNIDLARVKQIKYENGKVEKYSNEVDKFDKELYVGQRDRIIKFNLFAPLLGYSEFSYQKGLSVGQSYQASLGLIGLGKQREVYYDYFGNVTKSKQAGLYGSFGYRFKNVPDYINRRNRMAHLMHGAYIQPTVYLGYYKENQEIYNGTNYEYKRLGTMFGSFEIEFGKQWIFANRVSLDIFLGLGLGFDNKARKDVSDYGYNYYSAYNYGISRLGKSPSFTSSSGLRIGYLFDLKKDKK